MSKSMIQIGFLTASKVSRDPLTWVSKAVEKLSGKYTHAFVVYQHEDTSYVRTMGMSGVKVNQTIQDYAKEYKDRIELLWLDCKDNNEYNEYCKTEPAKYDYVNLLLWQFLKAKAGYFFGWDTKTVRICSEDALRCIQIAIPYFPGRAESRTPTELYNLITDYNCLKI